MKKRKLKHIELFAGCGGLSLGLKSVGFELVFANELSPMAAETYAYNLLNEDLGSNDNSKKVKWLNSQFESDNLQMRLRENPLEIKSNGYSDTSQIKAFNGELIVGDINLLLSLLETNPVLLSNTKKENIDLISGGPPCQSFSLAGKRIKDDHKNTLPLSFAKITGLIQPKIVLLENVKGITSPFNFEGEKHFAWLEVSKAFALEGFVPVCMMLNSKYFGVAQNRPRFILVAYRIDIFKKLKKIFPLYEKTLKQSLDFYKQVNKENVDLNQITINDFGYIDIEEYPEMFNGDLLPNISTVNGEIISAFEAIEDLMDTEKEYLISDISNDYPKKINTIFKGSKEKFSKTIKNHEPRQHRFDVKARFRFYQVISQFQNGLKKSAIDLLTGKAIGENLRVKLHQELSKYELLFKDDSSEYLKKPLGQSQLQNLLESIPSKKHSQRALKENEPAPAQLTIPDDLCHYHKSTLRTLTVREMARFQSFPDWFEFRSKVTTGGKMRRFEVPQYTQVGNAVPPLLARSIGDTLRKQLELINNI